MKIIIFSIVIISMMTFGTVSVSCTSKSPVNEPQKETAAVADSTLAVTAENNIKAHQEDIQVLWESEFGKEKKFAKYALAGDYVLLGSEDGKDCLLLSFYKDIKDIDNFDDIPLGDGQELSFQGNALVVKNKEKTTYFEKTDYEGFNELFTVTEKDGKKTYTNDLDEPYDEKEAQTFIDKISKETVSPLSDVLSEWKNLK